MPYFVRIRGKAFGPFDENQLLELKNHGKLGKTTEVSENRTDWTAAEKLDFLYSDLTKKESTSNSSGDKTAAADTYGVAREPQEPADWFYSTNGKEGFGPVTPKAIIQMIRTGTLRSDSLVWQDGQVAEPLSTITLFAKYVGVASNIQQPLQSPASQQSGFQPGNTGLFCAACGNAVVHTATICPRCGSPIQKLAQQQYQGAQFAPHVYPQTPNAGFFAEYFDVLKKKYADFNGRARRSEYWKFTISNGVISFCILCLLPLLGLMFMFFVGMILRAMQVSYETFNTIVTIINLPMFIFWILIIVIFNLYIIIPTIAVTARRLHDIGQSGWLQLITFVPFGGLILFVLLILDSKPGANQYGPNPKYM
ncbi:MAG: DUF805 domain-containing protein [Thermoguttaceae bacterium]